MLSCSMIVMSLFAMRYIGDHTLCGMAMITRGILPCSHADMDVIQGDAVIDICMSHVNPFPSSRARIP